MASAVAAVVASAVVTVVMGVFATLVNVLRVATIFAFVKLPGCHHGKP